MGPVSFAGAAMAVRQVVVSVGVLLVAGCGGSSDDAESTHGFTKHNITQRMTEALVAEGSMHMEMSIEAGPQRIVMSGDQVVGKSMDDSAMSMSYSESGEEPMEMRLVEGLFYVNFGESSEGKFVRVDPKDADSPMGRAFAPMIDELDITKSIREFADAITEVEQDGDDKRIDGVTTTPYQVTMDVDRAKASGALDEDTKLRSGASIEYTFYLDAEDRLRRMESTVDSAEVRVDLTNIGEPVDIVAPPTDETVDESEFQGGA